MGYWGPGKGDSTPNLPWLERPVAAHCSSSPEKCPSNRHPLIEQCWALGVNSWLMQSEEPGSLSMDGSELSCRTDWTLPKTVATLQSHFFLSLPFSPPSSLETLSSAYKSLAQAQLTGILTNMLPQKIIPSLKKTQMSQTSPK